MIFVCNLSFCLHSRISSFVFISFCRILSRIFCELSSHVMVSMNVLYVPQFISSTKRFYVRTITANVKEIFQQWKTIYIECMLRAPTTIKSYVLDVMSAMHIFTLIIESQINNICNWKEHAKLNSLQILVAYEIV